MPEKFEIEVPISVKGGLGGDEGGKKVVNSVAGLSKGLKGIVSKFGAIGAAITAAVGILSKASPYLKGILSIFGRAFMIFFRPFGDFLATLLRPLAILMMKMAVAFLKWTRPLIPSMREGEEKAPQIPVKILGPGLGGFVTQFINTFLKIGGMLGQLIYDHIIMPAANFITKIIFTVGDWISSKILGIWEWVKDFPGWLWSKITGIWTWAFDFAGWIWEKITSVWNWTYDFAGWLWGKITSIFRTGPFGVIGKVLGIGQVGIPSVPHEGLYHLHKGEEVVPRTKAGQNKSIIFKPTFQITGNIAQDIDMDAIVRRAGRQTEMDLKQRGII